MRNNKNDVLFVWKVLIALLASFCCVVFAAPPGSPTIIAYTPDPTTDPSPLLMWNAVSGANKYKIEIDTANTFATPYLMTDSTAAYEDTSYQTASLEYNTIYWRVYAGNVDGWSPASTTDDFAVLGGPQYTTITLDAEAGTGADNDFNTGGADVGTDCSSQGGTFASTPTKLKILDVPMENTANTFGTINFIEIRAYAKADIDLTGLNEGIQVRIELNFNPALGTTHELTDSYAYYSTVFTLNPVGGAWSWGDINGVRGGVKTTASGLQDWGQIDVDHVEMIVYYTAPPHLLDTNSAESFTSATCFQRTDGNGNVEINYRISDDIYSTATVKAEYFNGSTWGAVTDGNLTGDKGTVSTTSGSTNRQLVWDVSTEVGTNVEATDYNVRIIADNALPLSDTLTFYSNTLVVDTKTPTGFGCSSPADDMVLDGPDVSLTSSTATDANTVSYFFEIDDADPFVSAIANSGWQSADNDWIATGLATSQTYSWRVRVKDYYGNQAAFSTDFAFTITDATPPDNDMTLNSTPIAIDKIELTWNPSAIDSSDADSIGIWYKTTDYPDSAYDGSAATADIHTLSTTKDTVSGLLEKTLYYFALTVRDSSGNWADTVSSACTAVYTLDKTAPNNVTGLSATAINNSTITLEWTPSGALDADSVMIRYRTDGTFPTDTGNGTFVKTLPNTETADTVNSLLEKTSYTFSLFARDTSGNWCSVSAGAQDSAYTPDGTLPENVTGLDAVYLGGDSVSLTWSVSVAADAESLSIRYRTDGAYPVNFSDGIQWAMHDDSAKGDTLSGLQEKMVYRFGVFVRDSSGNWSAAAVSAQDSAAIPDMTSPDNVTGLAATSVSNTSIALAWTNTTSSDTDSLMIRYRTNGVYPADTGDGTLWAVYPLDTTGGINWPPQRDMLTVDTVTGLLEKVQYNFSVFVRDSSGNWCDTSSGAQDSATTPDQTPPDNNLALTLTSIGDSSIAVSWDISGVTASDVQYVNLYYQWGVSVTDTAGTLVSPLGQYPFVNDSTLLSGTLKQGFWYFAGILADSSGNKSALVNDSVEIKNTPPVFVLPDSMNLKEDSLWIYTVSAYDLNSDPLNFGITEAPDNMVIDAAGGILTWTPRNDDVGMHPMVLSCSDGYVTIFSDTTWLYVENVNDTPFLSLNTIPDTVYEDSSVIAQVYVGDDDQGDSLSAGLVSGLTWITGIIVEPNRGPSSSSWTVTLSGTPLDSDTAWNRYTLKITDREGAYFLLNDSMYVVNTNDPPRTFITGKDAVWGAAQYTFSAKDDFDTSFTFCLELKSLDDRGTYQVDTTRDSIMNYFPLIDGRYVFGCCARDSAGLTDPTPAIDTFTIIGASKKTFAYPDTVWHMLSVPAGTIPADSLKNNAYFLHWDESQGEDKIFKYYKQAASINSLQPGLAYWRMCGDTVNVNLSRSAVIDTSVTVPLHKGKYGWNQIASPFPYSVTWPRQEVVWGWNAETGDYYEETGKVLEPWKGYWVLVDSSSTVTFKNDPLFEQGELSRVMRVKCYFSHKQEWRIQVKLVTESGIDEDNIFGFTEKAENGRDLLDRPEPPRMSGYSYLFFAHPEWQYSVNEFASDMRKKWKNESIFQIGIAPGKSSRKSSSLEFQCVGNLSDVYLFLADPNSIIPITSDSSYVIGSSDKMVYKAIFISDDENFLDRFPRVFKMFNPYPNPFNRMAIIKYTLPYRWSGSGLLNDNPYVVTIKLYDARGRMIRNLVHRKQKPGRYITRWDGKSNNGSIVASGFYICRITAGKYHSVKRMIMLK